MNQQSWIPLLAAGGGAQPNPVMILPFALMLMAIALMPYIHKHWWEAHYPKVAAGLGSITVLYYLFGLGETTRMLHAAEEYAGFIALIGSLFVVSGGIHIQIRGRATPAANCLLLFFGAVLSNLIGTTGASMLLIRPWIRLNRDRISAFHVVFFIFIVSNVGGCLTPIGDPPLFLGYLRGIHFWWVLEHCWSAWALALLGLVGVFFFMDRANHRRAALQPMALRPEADPAGPTWKIEGLHNLAFLALILAAVFLRKPPGLSEGLMVVAAIASYWTTPKRIHEANRFNFEPIREVAWLFIGIFATMVPALDYLETHAAQFGLNTPMKLYWFTGSLSAALDNAPTYLTFLAAAAGAQGLSLSQPAQVIQFAHEHAGELIAISLASVFFGASTYIGNGPNFMVKSICEQSKVSTPGFADYILKYTLPVLLPILAVVAFVFFSGMVVK
jgi:Na+/H+ antiporter NhaD/arsenite permease-like protein